MEYIPFHQYQRYKTAELIIRNLTKKKNVKILEIGANKHNNLEKFLPEAEITYLDIDLDEEQKTNPKYILADATDVKLQNSEYDYIIALDVLEHIEEKKRKIFLDNIQKNCVKGFIISFPYSNSEVEFLEKRIEASYDYLFNEKIIWNEEHKLNGLPIVEDVIDSFNLDFEPKIFYQGDFSLFERMYALESFNRNDDKKAKYWNEVNSYYNNNIFLNDLFVKKERGIRCFIAYDKNEEVLSKSINDMKKESLNSINRIGDMHRILDIYEENIKGYYDNHILNSVQSLQEEYSLIKAEISIIKDNSINLLNKEKEDNNIKFLNLERDIITFKEDVEVMLAQKDLKIEEQFIKIKELNEFKNSVLHSKSWKITSAFRIKK